MRVLVAFVIMLLNMVLQSSVFQYFEILGIKPITSIIFVVAYGMLRGDIEGAIFGFFSGLLQDAYFGSFLGLHACLGMLTGYFCGKPFKDFYRENYLLALFLTIISFFAYEFLFYFTSLLFRGQIDVLFYFRNIILPETVYSAVLTLPVYRIMYGINKRLEEYEKRRRKLF